MQCSNSSALQQNDILPTTPLDDDEVRQEVMYQPAASHSLEMEICRRRWLTGWLNNTNNKSVMCQGTWVFLLGALPTKLNYV